MLLAKNIYKSFGNYQVINNFSYEFKKNEFIAIMGASGSGKTTLLSILATLLKPTRGNVFFKNINLTNLNENEVAKFRNKHFGFVFQSANMISHLKVWENVILPFFYGDYQPLKEMKEKALNLLNFVGLEKMKNRNVNTLSGGEQQRLAIARALINNPDIIFADEPTGNLDKENTDLVIKILSEFTRQGKCVIMVTHDEYVAKNCDKIIRLSKYNQ